MSSLSPGSHLSQVPPNLSPSRRRAPTSPPAASHTSRAAPAPPAPAARPRPTSRAAPALPAPAAAPHLRLRRRPGPTLSPAALRRASHGFVAHPPHGRLLPSHLHPHWRMLIDPLLFRSKQPQTDARPVVDARGELRGGVLTKSGAGKGCASRV